MTERGKVIPGIEKLARVEEQIRNQSEINGQSKPWTPPSPEELRKFKKGLGKVSLGDIR